MDRKTSSYPDAVKNKKYICGDLIVSASPYAHVISMSQNGSFCDNCCLPSDDSKLLKCSACKYEHYCSKSCQRQAWRYHKFECILLRRKFPKIPSDSTRLLTKLVWNIHHGIKRPENDPGWREFSDLCSHKDDKLVDDVTRGMQYSELYVSLQIYLDDQFGLYVPNQDFLMETFGRMVFNTFTLTHSCKEIGSALYISPSMFNHSCCPNAVFVSDGAMVSIRAVKDIDTSKEEIFVNYIEPLESRETRRTDLASNYLFLCECQKCCNDDLEAVFNAIICPFCHHDVPRLPESRAQLQCQHCERILDDDFMRRVAEAEDAAIDLNKEALKNTDSMIEKVEEFLSKNKVLSSTNVHITKVLLTLYADQSMYGDKPKAYQLGQKLVEDFKQHYPKYFPMHGEHHVKQARLAWHIDELDKALEHYQLALSNLLVTHGPDHHLTKLVRSDISECERDKIIARFQQNRF